MQINSTMPVGGFLDDLLGFGQKVVGAVTDYQANVANQKLTLAQQQAQIEAQKLAAAEASKAKSRLPLYLGIGAVVVLGGLYLAKRRR